MDQPIPENSTSKTAGNSVSRSKSLTVIKYQTRLQKLLSRAYILWNQWHDSVQRLPLAYKLSFFITVLVVSCMLLLGTILVQQQTQLLQEQIDEQGSTLVRLMSQSAKEPLLAEDELALDAIVSSFANSSSVLGTAITSLEGEIITQAGIIHEERNPLARNALQQIIANASASHEWEWQAVTGYRRQTVMSFMHPVVFQNVTAGYALVTLSQSGMQMSARKAVQAITGATILIIGVGIAMAFALGNRITQPINRLVTASHTISKGDYTFRFEERRKDELGVLMDAFNEMAQGMLEKSQVKNALSRYVSPGVAREILSNLDNVELSGKRVEGSVLFADIKGFTQIAEKIRPEELVEMLNRYFTLITCACEINHGIVDKYMGDGVMLVFGAPEPDTDHAFHAVSCALLIQKLVTHENKRREEQGMFPVEFRIGVNTGRMLAGNMGSRERMEYTVVGDTVNLASRLCGITNGGEIVISRDMYMRDDIQQRVLAGEYQSIRLRGISQAVSTYRVEHLTADYMDIIEEQFAQILSTEDSEICDA